MPLKTIRRKNISGIKTRSKISKKKRVKSIRNKKYKVSKKRKGKGGALSSEEKKDIMKRSRKRRREHVEEIIKKYRPNHNFSSNYVLKKMLKNDRKTPEAIPARYLCEDFNKISGSSRNNGYNIYMDNKNIKHVLNILENSRERHVICFLKLSLYKDDYVSRAGLHSVTLWVSWGKIYIIEHVKIKNNGRDGMTPVIYYNESSDNNNNLTEYEPTKHKSLPIKYINTSWQDFSNNKDCLFLTMRAMVILGKIIAMKEIYRPFSEKEIKKLEEIFSSDLVTNYELIYNNINNTLKGDIISYRKPTSPYGRYNISREAYTFNVYDLDQGLFLYITSKNTGIFKGENNRERRANLEARHKLWMQHLDAAVEELNPSFLAILNNSINTLLESIWF